MGKVLKPVPEYAAHLDQKKYSYWSKFWKIFDYTLPELKTAEDAAAFLMIAAVEADAETSKYLTYNDGCSIQPVAALSQYREDVAVPGMEIVLTRLFNMKAHGPNAFNNLVQTAAYRDAIWTGKTVSRFLELISAVPVGQLTQHGEGAMADQPPLHQAACDILRIADGYLRTHEGDKVVRDGLAAYCHRLFTEGRPEEDGAKLLAYTAAPLLDRYGSDEEIRTLMPQVIALTGLTPAHQYFDRWKKGCPRLLL